MGRGNREDYKLLGLKLPVIKFAPKLGRLKLKFFSQVLIK